MSKKVNLFNDRDIHWRTTDDGYEYIMRTVAGMKGVRNINEAERQLWLTRGWEKRLEKMRKAHRGAGIPDQNFWHPKKIAKGAHK